MHMSHTQRFKEVDFLKNLYGLPSNMFIAP
jgi:hypothetical protein